MGAGTRSFAEPWFDQAGTSWQARLKWTKRIMWVGLKRSHRQANQRKAIVVIAAEVAGTGIGRIRMSPVPDVAARSLERCVRAAISEGSVVHTDGWRGYSGLKRRGYEHRPKNIAASGDPAHVVMPRVHRVASPETLVIGDTSGGD